MAQQPPKQDGVKPKDYGVRRPRPIMGKVSHAMGGIARPVPHPIIANKPQGGDKAKVKESPLVRTPRGKDTAPHASGKSESKDHSTTNHA